MNQSLPATALSAAALPLLIFGPVLLVAKWDALKSAWRDVRRPLR